ncbi:hypothetical protein FOZ63_001271, partial [Perkinsus olseni]
RVLSEYYKDRFESLQRRSQQRQQDAQQEMSPFLGGPQSSRFLQYIPYESMASRSFVDLEAGEGEQDRDSRQQQQPAGAAQPVSKAAKKRKKRQAKKAAAATKHEEATTAKAKSQNSNSGAKQPSQPATTTAAGINSSTVSTVVSPGGSSARSRSPSEVSSSSSSSSSSDSFITPVHESTLVRAKTAAVEPLVIRAPVVAADDDGEWQTVGKSKSKRSSPAVATIQKKQQSSAATAVKGPAVSGSRGRPTTQGRDGKAAAGSRTAKAVGPRTAKDTSNGSAPKTSSVAKIRTGKTAPVLETTTRVQRTSGEVEAALKRQPSVKVKRTFYEFYEPDSTDVFTAARQQLGLLPSEAPF